MSIGIHVRVLRDGSEVIIPDQGMGYVSLSDFALDLPGAGSHTYTMQIMVDNTAAASGDFTPESRRRVLLVMVVKK